MISKVKYGWVYLAVILLGSTLAQAAEWTVSSNLRKRIGGIANNANFGYIFGQYAF